MRTQIERAFSEAPKPNEDEITPCPCEECEALKQYFQNFDKMDFSLHDLRSHETLLMHGSPKAFRYFLPIFMIAAYENQEESGAIPDLIVNAISMDKMQVRLGQISEREIESIHKFLDYLVRANEYQEFEVKLAREALETRRKILRQHTAEDA